MMQNLLNTNHNYKKGNTIKFNTTKWIRLVPILMLTLIASSCSEPKPVEEWIIDYEFTIADKSRSELLLSCQNNVKSQLQHPETYHYIRGSDIFDRKPKSNHYRLFFKFYAQQTTGDDDYSMQTLKYDGYCKFDDEGNVSTSSLVSGAD